MRREAFERVVAIEQADDVEAEELVRANGVDVRVGPYARLGKIDQAVLLFVRPPELLQLVEDGHRHRVIMGSRRLVSRAAADEGNPELARQSFATRLASQSPLIDADGVRQVCA